MKTSKKERLTYGNIHYYGAGRVSIPVDMVGGLRCVKDPETPGNVLIPITSIHKLRVPKTDTTPQWWENAVSQSEEVVKYSGKPLLMRLPDGAFLTTGTYSESFYTWLGDIENDGLTYDRFVGGAIVENPVWTEDTNTQMGNSGIQATNVAATFISPESQHSKQLAELEKLAEAEGFDVPKTSLFPTTRKLMKHQEPVTKVMAWRGSAILADDVGSGKSSMFLTGYFSRAQWRMEYLGESFDEQFPLVIITKNALVENTKDECHKWFEGCNVVTLKGKKENEIPEDTHVIICPLSVAYDHAQHIIDMQPRGLIVDESHMVKNMMAKRTQGVLQIANYIKKHEPTPYIVCASATPVPNRTSELWTQLYIAGMSEAVIDYAEQRQKFPQRIQYNFRIPKTMPVDDQKKFEIRYCEGKPGRFGWDATGSAHSEELSDIMYDNGLIRRGKAEFITPLPLLHQDFIHCQMDEESTYNYDVAEREFKDFLVAERKKVAKEENWSKQQLQEEIAEKLMKAKHSEAIMKMNVLRQLSGIGKVDAVVDWIGRFFAGDPSIVGSDTHRKKLIVFAHHKEVQKRLLNNPKLQEYGMKSILAGQKNISEIVDDFQDPNSNTRLLICYSEAREGLTLTAAHDILIVEMPFLSSWILQMAGRCWARVSELYPPHEAHLHYAVSDTNIDYYLTDLIKSKNLLHKSIIEGQKALDTINFAESGEESEEKDYSAKSLTKRFMD